MAKKRLADCSVRCNGEQLDFNVWPRKGESNRDACLRKAAKVTGGKQCIPLRVRSIDGIGKAGTRMPFLRFKDLGTSRVTAAAARALRVCRLTVNEDCREACRTGIHALEREIKQEPQLGKLPRVRIVRED